MKNYPKIGIRPTIDGRQGGVRESLEEKTMAMAHAAKELIERSFRYADGTQRPGAVYLEQRWPVMPKKVFQLLKSMDTMYRI